MRDVHQHLSHQVDIAAVGCTDRDPDTIFLMRAAAFIENLAVAHDPVGDGDFDVVPGQQPRAAHADVRYFATLA